MTEPERSRRRRPAGTLRRALPFVLGGACVLAVALFGTLTGWTIAVAALGFGVTGLLAAYAGRRELFSVNDVQVALLAITAWTALSLVPLPASWVEAVAPESVIDARDTARALGEDEPTLATLTRSPTDTQRELLKAAAIAAAFFAALTVSQLRGRRAAVIAGASGALAAAAITVAHVITDADRVYGVYEFPWNPSLLGPIGNQNHLSGLCAMAVPALIGVALETQDRTRRALLLGAAAFSGAVALAAISRGGTVALAFGSMLLASLIAWHARKSRDPVALRRSLVALGILLTVAVVLTFAAYAFGELLARDFGASPTGKLELAAEGLVLLGESPWLGVGRGAFRIAYTHLAGNDRLYFPENLLVQWTTEWGVPATVALLVTLLGAWLRAARRAESTTQMGALAAVASMFVHDQVDFALENLAIAGATAVLFGAALLPPSRGRSGAKDAPVEPSRRATALRWSAPALTTALALLLGYRIHTGDARRLERELLAMIDEERFEEVDAVGREAMRRHPSEPIFPLVLGWAAASRDDRDAPRWLNRAMALAPTWPSPHLVTARWLARRGRFEQAWLEVREAERVHPRSGGSEVCVFVPLDDDPTVLSRVFVGEESRERILSQAAGCAGVPPAVAEALDRELLETTEGESDDAARVRMAYRSIRAHDWDGALAILSEASDEDWAVRMGRAQALLGAGRPGEAVAALEGRAPIDTEPRRLELVARAYAAAGDAESMRAAMESRRAFAAGSGPRLAANALLLGGLEEQIGNAGRAYQAYDDARRLDPTSPALARIAALAEHEGDLRRAYLARTELCRGRPEDSAECVAADRLERRMRE